MTLDMSSNTNLSNQVSESFLVKSKLEGRAGDNGSSHPIHDLNASGLPSAPALETSPKLKEIEEKVTAAWQEILETKSIGRDVSYWDLGHGGTRAIRLLQLIREKTGATLPVSVLYDCSTIATLSRWIHEGKTVSFTRLVLLKPGTSEQPPLFLCCGIGALALELVHLGRSIAYEGPVYALQPRGLNDGEPVYDNVAEMAADYLQAIREIHPHGPYLFAGYSVGGYTAIEMARTLEQQGAQVPFVALLDSHLFESLWPFSVWLSFMFRHSSKTAWHLAGKFLKGSGVARTSKSANRDVAEGWESIPSSSSSSELQEQRANRNGTRRRIVQSLQRFTIRFRNPRSRSFAARFAYYTVGLPHNLQRVLDNGFVLVAEYRPPFWDRRIIFFKSELGDSAQCDPGPLWQKYFPRLEVRPVPGNHRTMLHGANAVALANEISSCLSELT
jgi:thioesterase domain-containing protein